MISNLGIIPSYLLFACYYLYSDSVSVSCFWVLELWFGLFTTPIAVCFVCRFLRIEAAHPWTDEVLSQSWDNPTRSLPIPAPSGLSSSSAQNHKHLPTSLRLSKDPPWLFCLRLPDFSCLVFFFSDFSKSMHLTFSPGSVCCSVCYNTNKNILHIPKYKMILK